MRAITIVTVFALMIAPALSRSELVEADLFAVGDGLLTRDTQSGLEWLDLSYTFQRSYNDVASDATLTALRFRHAVPSEVAGLWTAANVLNNPTLASVTAFVGLLSQTSSSFPFPDVTVFAGGLHERDPFDPGFVAFSSVFIRPGQVGSDFNNESVFPFNTKDFTPNFSGNYLVRPASADDLLADLVSIVVADNLSAGIGNALDSKLQNAIDALGRAQSGDNPAAIGIMFSFINSVEAQRGKKLTDAQADELISTAQSIISSLEEG